jgi:hypothetical protein
VLRDRYRKEIGSVDVNTPESLHPIVRVRNCVKVLGEAGRGNQVVDLAMAFEDL